MKTKPLSDKDYLDLFKINENKYVIGIFQDGITVLKQQTRALNIFHALYHTKLKYHQGDPTYKIGIIGGGVAGLTFAAAALEANFSVTIIERQSMYLHMQFGCDTRKIHPNLYEWPDRKYSNPYAELPVLDWKHDSAANVSKQIIARWNDVKAKALKKNTRFSTFFKEILNCDAITISELQLNSRTKYHLTCKADQTVSEFCDLLIFATGYGTEKGIEDEANTPSYWRNDSYAQTDLHTVPKFFLVSGVGDGGLIDLFRLKILDFNYELILEIIEGHKYFPNLLQQLNKIRKDLTEESKVPLNSLFLKFANIEGGYYSYIFDALRARNLLRKNKIWLNDLQTDFQNTLDAKKMSFLHAFLIYILHVNERETNLEYRGGALTYDKLTDKWNLNGEIVPDNCEVIIRHGTDRMASIPSDYFNSSDDMSLSEIKTKQEERFNHGKVLKRWTNSDLTAIFNPGSHKRYEYITSETSILCTNYVSGLANIIKANYPGKKEFRVALHRLIYVKGEYYFQQITSYFGSKTNSTNNSIGQVFKIERGNVGLSFTTGKPYLIENDDKAEFHDLMEKMNLSKEIEKIELNNSFFTLPILSSLNVKNRKKFGTNLVLAIDAVDVDFFSCETGKNLILSLIFAATKGFIDAIHHHIKFDKVRMVEIDFEPLLIYKDEPEWAKINKCIKDISFPKSHLDPDLSPLKFNEFYSFTIKN